MSAGWNYPFGISVEHGRVKTSNMRENIRQSVEIILRTEPGERLLHPEFGTKLHQFLFENMDSQTDEMIRREVRHSLQMWEKRIWDIGVTTDMKHGELRVTVTYRIVDSDGEDKVEITL